MQIDDVHLIDGITAGDFIRLHHYRKTMPSINKMFYGGFSEGNLVAVMTLGYGTQPLATIRKIFPSLGVKDYLEVGRMCLVDELPKNSETNFMSRVFEQVKKDTKIKVIYSWSDGIMGKPGYVYQAANFLYAGKISTDVYITQEGYLIHPRSAKKLLEANAFFEHKGKLHWLTRRFCQANNITHLKGFQFRYVLFVCDRREKKRLMKESLVPLTTEYPKQKDVFFFTYDHDKSKFVLSSFPSHYKETLNAEEVSAAIRIHSMDKGLVRFQPSAQHPNLFEIES